MCASVSKKVIHQAPCYGDLQYRNNPNLGSVIL